MMISRPPAARDRARSSTATPRQNTRAKARGRPSAGEGHRQSARRMTTDLRIPVQTLIVLTLWLVTLGILVKVSSILLQVFLGFVLASALSPMVSRVERSGLSRGKAVAVVVAVLVSFIALLILLIVPSIIDQSTRLADNLPGYVDRGEVWLADRDPDLYESVRERLDEGQGNLDELLTGAVSLGTGIVQGAITVFAVLALALYLLLDGERIYGWLAGTLPAGQGGKFLRALPAVNRVVSGYLMGQAINSLLFGAFTFITLTVTGVPEPLLIALAAAILDAIPLVGATAATIPAVLLALTVSLPTAIVVLALFAAYQQIENYVIAPRVFRRTLQLHPFAVLVAVLLGARLLGILGVILALPITAAIPVVARIWREPALLAATKGARVRSAPRRNPRSLPNRQSATRRERPAASTSPNP